MSGYGSGRTKTHQRVEDQFPIDTSVLLQRKLLSGSELTQQTTLSWTHIQQTFTSAYPFKQQVSCIHQVHLTINRSEDSTSGQATLRYTVKQGSTQQKQRVVLHTHLQILRAMQSEQKQQAYIDQLCQENPDWKSVQEEITPINFEDFVQRRIARLEREAERLAAA